MLRFENRCGNCLCRQRHRAPYRRREVRNGLNFTERGFGVRGAVGTSDRGNTAASQMQPGQVDWDDGFGNQGVRWLHTGGIYAALSESTAEGVIEAVQAAQKHGVIVSYDLNYRPSLWKSIGGQSKAREVNRRIAEHVDVMIGNEEDFTACLGFEVEGLDENISSIEVENFKKMIEQAVAAFPNFKATAFGGKNKIGKGTANIYTEAHAHNGCLLTCFAINY